MGKRKGDGSMVSYLGKAEILPFSTIYCNCYKFQPSERSRKKKPNTYVKLV